MRGVVISGDNEEWGYDSDSDLETALDFCAPVWTFSFRIVVGFGFRRLERKRKRTCKNFYLSFNLLKHRLTH